MRDPGRSPRARRRYPVSAYLPFALLVTVPILAIVVLVTLVAHLLSPAAPVRPPAPTASPTAMRHLVAVPTATRPAGTTATSVPAPTIRGTPLRGTPLRGTPLRGTPIHTAAPTSTAAPLATVTVAESSANGVPVRPATVFRSPPLTLWAFASIPRVHAGDAIRFVWRDVTINSVVVDVTQTAQVTTPLFAASMYGFIGSGTRPTRPFFSGAYRIDVFHNKALVATGRFRVGLVVP